MIRSARQSSRPASSFPVAADRIGQIVGIGLLVEDPDLFPRPVARLQQRAWRMPSVLTGANLANRDLIYLGVSGRRRFRLDRPRQFAHCIRRGVDMVYIVENNGVYGLTKGQFSATADKGSKARRGAVNTDSPIDRARPCSALGASYVARASGRNAL